MPIDFCQRWIVFFEWSDVCLHLSLVLGGEVLCSSAAPCWFRGRGRSQWLQRRDKGSLSYTCTINIISLGSLQVCNSSSQYYLPPWFWWYMRLRARQKQSIRWCFHSDGVIVGINGSCWECPYPGPRDNQLLFGGTGCVVTGCWSSIQGFL